MTMKKHYKVLFVDDDKRYAEPLIERAYSEYQVDLQYHDNWEEAYAVLADDFDLFHAVIIDGKGKRTSDSKSDDMSHVLAAISDLREERGKGQYIPFVILSKYFEVRDLVDSIPFFEKNKEEDDLFKFLIGEIEKTPNHKIRNRYEEPFCILEQHFSSIETGNLYEAIKAFENNSRTENTLNSLRKIIEAVFRSLHEKDDDLIPYGCLRYENGRINLKWCELRLTGKTIKDMKTGAVIIGSIPIVLPDHLSLILGPIIKICSMGSHQGNETNISRYTLGMAVFGIIDLLIWYEAFVERYNNL